MVRQSIHRADRDLTEADFTKLLFSNSRTAPGLAVQLGWDLRYHTYRSMKSPTGFPDWVIVRERIVFIELKREGRKPTDDQQRWLDAIWRAGGESYWWRPSDLTAGEIAKVLSHRGAPPAPCECGCVFVHRPACERGRPQEVLALTG